MKIFFWVILCLLPSVALADERMDQVQRISKQADESVRAGAACNSFIQAIQNLDSSTRDYFSSKETALKVLLKAKDYPGTPPSTQKALDSLLYVSKDELPHGPLASELRSSISRLDDCRGVDFYGVLNRLLTSRKRYHFSQSEDSDLKTLIEKYLTRESSGALFLYQVRMMIRLLDLSVKEMLIFPSPDQRLKIESLVQLLAQSESTESKHLSKLETGQSEVADPKNINELKVNRPALIQILWQAQESQRLRLPLSDLVSQLK